MHGKITVKLDIRANDLCMHFLIPVILRISFGVKTLFQKEGELDIKFNLQARMYILACFVNWEGMHYSSAFPERLTK